jgi:hypothetical protein
MTIKSKSIFEKWFAGGTGDPPVPSGDSPDGTGATIRANGDRLFAKLLAAVPVGGSPTGAGGSPAPPIFKTGSNSMSVIMRARRRKYTPVSELQSPFFHPNE